MGGGTGLDDDCARVVHHKGGAPHHVTREQGAEVVHGRIRHPPHPVEVDPRRLRGRRRLRVRRRGQRGAAQRAGPPDRAHPHVLRQQRARPAEGEAVLAAEGGSHRGGVVAVGRALNPQRVVRPVVLEVQVALHMHSVAAEALPAQLRNGSTL